MVKVFLSLEKRIHLAQDLPIKPVLRVSSSKPSQVLSRIQSRRLDWEQTF